MEIKVGTSIRSINDERAAENKKKFDAEKVFVINIMGSPGAGKTSLLERTLDLLAGSLNPAVIEGDIYTDRDARRIEKHGVPVRQINTGGACHLDAAMVARVLDSFDLSCLDLLIIENVGNLVCPVEFNLGEDMKVAVLSITEGEDKPMKYPLLFRESQAVLLNKTDLAEITGIDMDALRRDIRKINPDAEIFEVSARNGRGIDDWASWLVRQALRKKTGER